MSGMGNTLSSVNPTIVAAFRTVLIHQGLIILVLALLLATFGIVVRPRRPQAAAKPPPTAIEPVARRGLRISFGLLWVFDGILQAQPAMPVGLADQVTVPAAGSSPAWVQHMANWAGLVWDTHPIDAAAAAVWIQLGIGVWMLACSRGPLSRLSGAGSIVWGLAVWIFGEAFGGIFAPGLTFLFGAPGGVVFYVVAGFLLVLPGRYWFSQRFGWVLLHGTGWFFLGMALLQAWPGRGFWPGKSGVLPGMISDMAQASQPHSLSRLVSGFGSFVAGHGFAVNLMAVIVLAAVGLAFLSRQRRVIQVAATVAIVFCLADWVLVEDFGFLGGLGTDPNNMVPVIALIATAWLAITRVPQTATQPAASVPPAASVQPTAAPEPVAAEPVAAEPVAAEPVAAAAGPDVDGVTAGPAAGGVDGSGGVSGVAGLWNRLGLARLADVSVPGDLMQALIGIGAVFAVLVGTVPMAIASTSPSADTIVATALNGTPGSANYPAPAFQLTDQFGRPVSLASLHGKAVLLTFLDPVCTTDCPLIAQEFREADSLLAAPPGRWS